MILNEILSFQGAPNSEGRPEIFSGRPNTKNSKMFIRLIKSTTILTALFFCLAGPLHSATHYIAPASEIPVRTGKSSKNKITAILQDGTKVSVIKKDKEWALIRTEKGTEGWMLYRYLTTVPPLSDTVERLKKENKNLVNQLQSLQEKQQETATFFSECQSNLDACKITEQKTKENYDTLLQDSSEVIHIKEMLRSNEKELEETKNSLSTAKKQLESINNSSKIKWFLTGAGVLITGWLIGLLTASRKKRRPSLL